MVCADVRVCTCVYDVYIVYYMSFLLQKRDNRLATLAKTSVKDENKEKWRDILTPDFMSSEGSAVEENLDGSQRHDMFYNNVSDLWWRAESVTSLSG